MKSLHQNFKDIEDEINFLKKKNNAMILSHFYQDEDIQDIADFIGDSLDLSKKAQKDMKKRQVAPAALRPRDTNSTVEKQWVADDYEWRSAAISK